MEVFNHAVQSMASFLYMYDSLLASTRPEWMQCVFNVLTGLFDRVGLKKNVKNTVGMM